MSFRWAFFFPFSFLFLLSVVFPENMSSLFYPQDTMEFKSRTFLFLLVMSEGEHWISLWHVSCIQECIQRPKVSHKVLYLWWFEYTWPMASGTIRRHGIIGGGMQKVCHCTVDFEVSILKLLSVWKESLLLATCGRVSSWPSSDHEVELSAALPAPCLPPGLHASCHDDNGQNF